MQKRGWIIFLSLPIIMLMGLLSFSPVLVSAIGEVTPTPAPQSLPEGTPTVPELLEGAWDDFQNNQYDEVISAVNEALDIEPDNAEAYLFRALAYNRMNRLSLALDDLTYAIELVPETYHVDRAVTFAPMEWYLYTFRGDTYRLMGEVGEAMFDYDTALTLNPYGDNILAFESRSSLNYDLGDTRAGDIDDSIARGLERLDNSDANGAIDFFSDAIESGEVSPSVAIAYYNRGIIFTSLGDNQAALEDWTKAIEVNPDMHIVYLARGITYREEGDIRAAGEDFYTRMTLLGAEFVEQSASIGDTLDIEMDYQRVVQISFEGAAGDTISLRARERGETGTDPLITLLDPAGIPIAGDDDFGGGLNSLIDQVELPESGTYTLWVSHAEGAYTNGFDGIIRVSIEGQ